MAQVYSAQLAAQADYIGTLLVLVPAGYKLVVRDIMAFHNASGQPAQLVWDGNITNQNIWWAQWTSTQTGFVQWTGRQVFEAGQSMQFVASDAGGHGVSFQVSGYKLLLP